VIASAQAAGLHEVIMALPQMYKTVISPVPMPPAKPTEGPTPPGHFDGNLHRQQPAEGTTRGEAPPAAENSCRSCQGSATAHPDDVRTSSASIAPQEAQAPQACGQELRQSAERAPVYVHVPNAAQCELLAVARRRYVALAAKRRAERVSRRWDAQYTQRPLGVVPDFARMHAAWGERRLRARVEALTRGVTVPQEFVFRRAPRAAEAARAMQRLQRQQRLCRALEACVGPPPGHAWPADAPLVVSAPTSMVT
jgi:hypothetical protein